MNIPTEYFTFKINVFKKIFFIILTIGLFTLLLGQKRFSLGFFVGGLLSMAILSLLYGYVLQIRNLSPQEKRRFIIPRALLIYFIMGAALFIGIKKGIPAFLGVAAGLLSLKVAIFIQALQERHVST